MYVDHQLTAAIAAVDTTYVERRPYFFVIGMKNTHPIARPAKLADWALFSRSKLRPNSGDICCQKRVCTDRLLMHQRLCLIKERGKAAGRREGD